MQLNKEKIDRLLGIVDQGLANSAVSFGQPGHMSVEAAVSNALGERSGAYSSATLRELVTGLGDASWIDNTKRAEGLRRLAIAQLGTAGTLDERRFAAELSRAVVTKLLPETLRIAASLQGRWHRYKLRNAATKCEQDWTIVNASPTAHRACLATIRANRAALMFRTADAAAAAAATATWAADSALQAHAATIASPQAARHNSTAFFAARAASRAVHAATQAAYVRFPGDELLSHFAEHLVQALAKLDTPGSRFLYLTEGVHAVRHSLD